MEFEQKKHLNEKQKEYHIENLKIARDFSKELLLEMKELVKSIVLFGSNTSDTLKKTSDIDLMIVLDNVSVYVSPELREAYRIIVNKLNDNVGHNKIHLMTINLSDVYDMSRKGDPLLINVLRYGVPMFDRDLIEPMQYLLEIGKIRPTKEAVYNYMARSETLLEDSNKHIQDAILDLYYSTVDIVHSTLMLKKVTPPSPKEMPKLFKKEFGETGIGSNYKLIEELYTTAKKIEIGQGKNLNGSDFDKLKLKTDKLFTSLKKHNEKELSKKDDFDL